MVKPQCFSKGAGLPLLFCLPLLTGCPGTGSGDYLRPDETAYVSKKGEQICFTIPEAEDYQPVYIAINPRGRPPGEQTFTQHPPLRVDNGWLCIPPSFYPFPDSSSVPFIVETILHSSATNKPARTFVAGVGLSNGRVYAVPLTNKEITR